MKLYFRVWILIVVLLMSLLVIKPTFESGVIVKSIESNSSVFAAGLRQSEIITSINEIEIKNKQEYAGAINSIFIDDEEKRLSIKTNKNAYIFLTDEAPKITVDNIPKTRIQTGLDLRGGARALVKTDVEISDSELDDLVGIARNRFNVYGLSDVNIKGVSDLGGNKFMLVEVAGASPNDLEKLISQQGKFEAKIKNQTVFEGGEKDISDVCRNDATCAAVTNCFPVEGGEACNFQFSVYLKEEAAQRHADVTSNITLDETGQYLSERLYLFIDGNEASSLLISSGLRGQVTTQISIQGSGTGETRERAIENTRAEMNRLQTILLTGSLPYELEIVKLDTISPTLGKEFTRGIALLALVSFAVVSIILFVRYRKIKLTLAVIMTMFSEAFITLGIAAFLKWNLDAASIAGIIAGMGTGVNDQIVIIDESEADEKSTIKEKVKRALFIIMGAFFTIFVAMLPLFWAGAGMLRGFAFTTIIGITVGILITRPAFADIVRKIEG